MQVIGGASTVRPPAMNVDPTNTVTELGPVDFNAALARKLQGLRRKFGCTQVSQGYKGTGSQAHRRQVWIRHDALSRGTIDLWLEADIIRIGGVVSHNLGRVIYADKTVDAVYAELVTALAVVLRPEAKGAAM